MAKYFRDHPESTRRNLEGIRRLSIEAYGRGGGLSALELGSGNGFLSVCLAAVAGDLISELAITDDADHLPLIEATLSANARVFLKSAEKTRIAIVEHMWGEFDDGGEERRTTVGGFGDLADNGAYDDGPLRDQVRRGTKKFDLIFGSDLAYRDHLHEPLISSLVRFSHKDTVALIGVTMADTRPIFFDRLRDAGFRYERLADHLMDPDFRGRTFGLIAIQKA